MGVYREIILPKILDLMLGQPDFQKLRHQLLSRAQGDVLELGLGTGLSLEHYPKSVKRLYAIDPSVGSRKVAYQRAKALGLDLEYLDSENLEHLSIPKASIDTLVSCFTLCTIPDVKKTLVDLRAFLNPNVQFLFLEHGRAQEASVSKWQDRLNPIQKTLFAGCHLNRDISGIISDAGYTVKDLKLSYVPGPKIASFMYSGYASIYGKT